MSNNACNCCVPPPDQLQLIFGYKEKLVRSKFCPTSFQFLGAAYREKAAGELQPSVPSNPDNGPLYSSLSISYSDNETVDMEPSEGICFDLVSGSDSYDFDVNLTEMVKEDLKIKTADLYRENDICSNECEGPNNPKLIGSGTKTYKSERVFQSLVNGGCGADYFDYCGYCPEEISCSGDGTTPIIVNTSDEENYEFSVDGCRAFVDFPYADYPSTQGSYTRTQTEEANCCFSFVCLAQVNSSPNPNPLTIRTNDEYDIVDLPSDIDKTTTTPIEPIDISDVIAAANSKLNSTEYFPEEEYNWETESIAVIHNRSSSPFTESGFLNSATVDMSQKEYVIRIGAPTFSCYVKLWFVEEFLPEPKPEDWPLDPVTGQPQKTVLSTFTIEHNFEDGGVIPKKCFKNKDINFVGDDGFSFEPENSILLTPEPRTLTPPVELGTKYLRLLKYSFLPDYTPNDPYLVLDTNSESYFYTQGCKPNGFPDPSASENDPRISCE